MSIVVLNLTVGVLFLMRRPIVRHGGLLSIAASLPAFVAGPIAMQSAPPTSEWPRLPVIVFCSGTVLAVVAFLWLGRSFAIFPAARRTVYWGPYRIVRHPAYVGELAMIVACLIAAPYSAVAALCVVIALPSVVARILAEERLLTVALPDYGAYAEQVRWRLLPGVW